MPVDSTLRVALVQLAVHDGAPETNVTRAESLIAAAPDADLYLLPELWTTGYTHDAWRDVARTHTASAIDAMQRIATRRDAWVGGSVITETDEGALVNRFWLVAPNPSLRAGQAGPVFYDKSHLFAPMSEHKHLVGGTSRVRTCVGRDASAIDTSLSICFDLRFPEQYRRDAVGGAQLFAVVAEWPHPRGEALRLFARARAAENQAYLALCNRVGPAADGSRFCGGSALIAPDGSIIVDAGSDEETVVVGTVDRQVVDRYRAEFPVVSLRVEGVDY